MKIELPEILPCPFCGIIPRAYVKIRIDPHLDFEIRCNNANCAVAPVISNQISPTAGEIIILLNLLLETFSTTISLWNQRSPQKLEEKSS